MKYINYDKGTNELKNWLIEEQNFDNRHLGKWEALFCQGNGYLGLRSSLEEEYVGETRNLFVTGTFNKFGENEVTELPNFPDVTKMVIQINKKRFSMDCGIVHSYSRTMNLKNGEVIREVEWESPDGEIIEFRFCRMVSMAKEHVIAQSFELTPKNKSIQLQIESGIDGKVSNSGSQHFYEGTKRIYDNRYIEMVSDTTESGVTAAMHCAHTLFIDGKEVQAETLPVIERRTIKARYTLQVEKNSTFKMEKITSVHTSRDMAYIGMDTETVKTKVKHNSKQMIIEIVEQGYDSLLKESSKRWEELWRNQEITVDSVHPFDQLAIRFAIYHLNIMMKKDDNRVGIGAKAMSGEGYKGHSFWDTEVFILPYFMMAEPQTARTLLEYRYKNLYGARKKAKENGFEGAMYPWESAWIEDGEVTPLWGAADVVTGETLKILTGLIEQHITADIAYAVWQYYNITKDEEFLNLYGYEMIMDTAKFWTSRLEWNEEKNYYEITDVIGPDEYKEHVDNNAYTNYLTHYNMKLALSLIADLKEKKPDIYQVLNETIGLDTLERKIEEMLPKIYLPLPDEKTGIIPQFDGYFNLASIDLTKYKESTVVGTIYNDYNVEQINGFQVLKQADLVVLFYLMDDLFDYETKKKNYLYYESRTLHDSSLSKSTHSIIANDLGFHEEAYSFFQGAGKIDLGEEMNSSNAGIHSASMGGIWQSAILGFGGVRMVGGELHISPSLPKEWGKLQFPINFHGSRLLITVINMKQGCVQAPNLSSNQDISETYMGVCENITVENTGEEVEFLLMGEKTLLKRGEVKEVQIRK